MRTATPSPRARTRDPMTSQRAAAAVGLHLSDLQADILRVFRETFDRTAGGLTDRELVAHPALRNRPDGKPRQPETLRGRRAELTAAGYLTASGATRNRCTVWIPVPRPTAGRLF